MSADDRELAASLHNQVKSLPQRQIEMLYKVEATDTDRNRLIGIFQGRREDIEAYCVQKQDIGYCLCITEIVPIAIPSNYKEKLNVLLKEKAELERQITILNTKIGNL